ncbi:hypothetical protein J8L04_17045 [Bacteroides fragilis]|uniref:hypothetical protein n=1 Tax=Bacteroides TaxID=816 RepID=UPI000696F2BB|nr:hypothetical protein [Bacteroides fragilis]MCM0228823.1 hypothetical protein [Bacteroides fragilis]QCQ49754.1 hypothetical protein EE52_010175 [Bacteroides fragilis]QCQ50784.1 hypothetical protein EE52_016000 [Bacteroides fragilis]
MKNNAAKIVADSLLGTYYKEVKLGKFTYRIYQPTIKDLLNILNDSGVSINEGMKRMELIAQMPEHVEECARAISYAVSINKPEVYRKMAYQYITHYATMEQIVNAFVVLSGVINGKELFDSVKMDKFRSKNGTAETIGANSIFGAMGSLMDSLHLTYKEAFEVIPYPCLLMMNADKLRVLGAGEDKLVEVSTEEFFRMRAERRGNNG